MLGEVVMVSRCLWGWWEGGFGDGGRMDLVMVGWWISDGGMVDLVMVEWWIW